MIKYYNKNLTMKIIVMIYIYIWFLIIYRKILDSFSNAHKIFLIILVIVILVDLIFVKIQKLIKSYFTLIELTMLSIKIRY